VCSQGRHVSFIAHVLDPKITATALQKTDSFRHDIPKPKLELLQRFFSQLLNLEVLSLTSKSCVFFF
jgi:hypothetical protein